MGHGLRGGRLFGWLSAHVLSNRLGEVLLPETGYILARDPDTVLSPDGAFIRAERVPRSFGRSGFSDVVPDLVIEVLSPCEHGPAIGRKIAAYLDAGVAVVWVVDSRRRSVTVHRFGRDPLNIPESGELDGDDVAPGFRLKVAEIFE